MPSKNSWDWLADGIYFWEQNPQRALDYAQEVSMGDQYNKVKIKTAFVLGAIIELGHCLNLVEAESLNILDAAYQGLAKTNEEAGLKMPKTQGNIRKLDCAVISFIHESRRRTNEVPYDSIRSAFNEGLEIYPGASFTARNHIQICIRKHELIKGYFLPTPIKEFNPNL